MTQTGPGPATAYAQAHALHRAGRLEDASRVLGWLLARWPGHVDARNLAGVICMQRRDHAGAAVHLRKAVAHGAGAGVMANLGFALQSLGDTEAAARCYAQAVAREPAMAFAWQKLAGLREAMGEPMAALEAYRRAIALDPGDLKSVGEALELRRHMADWDPASGPSPVDVAEGFRAASRSDFSPGILLALPEADAALQKEAAARFARSQWAPALASPPLAAPATPAEGRRLRIGYLSSDFRNHAVSFLALEPIAAHDRASFEVFLYAYGPQAPGDPWRRAAEDAADRFTDVDGLDDAGAARRIARDGIDVLVDLNGYTRHGRPGILAHRPAPVAAGWIGYIGTLGEPRLADYVISDAVATPPALAPHFSESLALMPRCFQPNGRLRAMPAPPARADEGLPDEGVVFCSFNQAHKLHPALWDDWCAILRAVPGSVLWLAVPRLAPGEANLRREAERRGVEPGRIVFGRQRSREAHLARLPLADVALDTWPYNSGTTASDALRMGVPLVSLDGTTFAGRMAASLLAAVGLGDCVTPDRAAYVALATRLALEPAALAALRRRQAEGVARSALFDPASCARDLEALYRAMHANACAGRHGPIHLPR